MWRTSAVFVIPLAMYVAPSTFELCIPRSVRLASLKIAWGTHPVSNAKITNVHAGAENRTAIHLHPFRELCQCPFFGFHRFFPVFPGFCSYLVTFSVKIPRK
jgi:hypothetical protein